MRISYSAYDCFKRSELQFYFQYVLREKPTDSACKAYGVAGNVVHNAIETYIKEGLYVFDKLWQESGVANMQDLKGRPLPYTEYKKMYLRGVTMADRFKETICQGNDLFFAEKVLETRYRDYEVKGILDVFAMSRGSDAYIIDWKTNSKPSEAMHRTQRLFYSWLYKKVTGIAPKCVWVYLRDGETFKDEFTAQEIDTFEKEIDRFIAAIENKGDNISKYALGDFENPFNEYLSLCHEENTRRLNMINKDVVLEIRGYYVFLKYDDPRLAKGIDYATKFNLPEKYYMQEAAKSKGRFNIDDVGTYHLYNLRLNCFPIGLLDRVRGLIQEYANHYGKNINIRLFDLRDSSVLHRKQGGMPGHLMTDKTARPYQIEAINAFMGRGAGIINLATGAGKSYCAFEIIRRVDGKVLWIIDRKELMLQTKDEMEKHLGINIGVFSGKDRDIDCQVTISTIQTLHKYFGKVPEERIKKFFYNINFVIIDEYHKSAAETYQKTLTMFPNALWRLGLTATVYRDDGKTPVLNGAIGEVLYKKSAKELEEEGYLMRPEIKFYNIVGTEEENYVEDYTYNIVQNTQRNEKIKEIAMQGKKTLIFTKIVAHGKNLKEMIPGSEFLHGSLSKLERGRILDSFRQGTAKVLIGTISIFSEGIDIPDLEVVINASANKGDVKSIQAIGRVMRLCVGKNGAKYVDFCDGGQYTSVHSECRMNAFKEQGYEIEVE